MAPADGSDPAVSDPDAAAPPGGSSVETGGGPASGAEVPPVPPAPFAPGPRPPGRRDRFVISQLLARYRDARTRSDMVDLFALRASRSILPNVDLMADLGGDAAPRRVLVVEADPEELAAKRAELTADAVIEPERPRSPAALGAALRFDRQLRSGVPEMEAEADGPPGVGTGGSVALTLRGPDGEPVAGAIVQATFLDRRGLSAACAAGARSDAGGRVDIPFDPDRWLPAAAAIIPRHGYWNASVCSPQAGQTVRLARLPRRGPFGWWQWLSGTTGFDAAAGEGIVIGVVDTGVGPHAHLDHVTPVGAFLDGRFSPGVELGRDASDHGTHVAGLIAARPAPDSGDFAGLAPGADLRVARVFSPDRLAHQGDVALAVSALASTHGADLINLSLTGESSEIERDAILVARREGTLCIAAAGNGGTAVSCPAAYPECAAVSALGLLGSFPTDADAAGSVPAARNRFGVGGLYLAAFSNVGGDFGPQIACAAAGSAVISTVPAWDQDPAPYAEMSGTSMAAPLATGALAALLSRDRAYRGMVRSGARSDYAAAALAGWAVPVGLARTLAGAGLARMR